MIEPRVYRAAFVPALLAVVLAMFSLESRPRPLPQGLAADVLFDGAQAADLATRIATDTPDRRAGTPGTSRPPSWWPTPSPRAGSAAGAAGSPHLQRFTHAGHDLVNVVGRRAGQLAPRRSWSWPRATRAASRTRRAAPRTPPR